MEAQNMDLAVPDAGINNEGMMFSCVMTASNVDNTSHGPV